MDKMCVFIFQFDPFFPPSEQHKDDVAALDTQVS